MIAAPYPELDDLLKMMGEAGWHLAEIEASEGLSVDEMRLICKTFNVQQNIF